MFFFRRVLQTSYDTSNKRRVENIQKATEEKHEACIKKLQDDLRETKAELETERTLRIHFEGRARQLEAVNRRLRGTRPKAGDELY